MEEIRNVRRVEKNLNKENRKPDYNKVYFGPQWKKMGVQEKSSVHKTLSVPYQDDIFCIDSDAVNNEGVKSPLLMRKCVNSVSVESLEIKLPGLDDGPDEGYNSSFGSEHQTKDLGDPISSSSPYTSDSENLSDSDNNDEICLSDSENNNNICLSDSENNNNNICLSDSESTNNICLSDSENSIISNCNTLLQCSSQSSLSSLFDRLDNVRSTSNSSQTTTTSTSFSTQTASKNFSNTDSQTWIESYDQSSTATPSCSTQITQTEPKLISRGCQAEDSVVCDMNKKLLVLRDRFNKKLVQEEDVRRSLGKVKKECSDLRMDRFSLISQVDELQKNCIMHMSDKDKLQAQLDHKDCQLQSLRQTLDMRDAEISEMRKQLKGASPRHLTDYRELEMLRIDNIRLLHDNRALTSSVDSLNAQLYALRRISKHTEETDSLVQMNERLAEDNNSLSVNLNAIKREHRNIVQEQEETLEELRYVRSNYKRTLSERDQFHRELLSVKTNTVTHCPPTSLQHDNEALSTQNDSLKETVSILTGQLSLMREELETIRSSRDIALLDIDTVLDEKHKVQNELAHMETSNSELWARLGELRQNCSELNESLAEVQSNHEILKSESEELRATNNLLLDNLDKLNIELQCTRSTNEELSNKVSALNTSLNDASLSMSDLRCTMEFLQVEHGCIECEMDKKDSTISVLQSMVTQHKHSKEDLRQLCKKKLKEKTKQLNNSRIKLGYALLEIRELNSQGSASSSR